VKLPVTARAWAWEALRRIDHEGAYANLVLPELLAKSKLDERDRALVTELVYGTTRMRRACDHLVDRFVLSEPEPAARSLLRLGAYQLAFTRMPDHAVVDETVGIAPARWRGFANAILRRVAKAPIEWPDDATRLSYPDWIVDRLRHELGEADAFAALEKMNEPPPVTQRADGYYQDLASTWVADLVGAQPGERVFDMCAAPGGKATRMAATGATVIAGDRQPHRVKLMRSNRPDMPVLCADGLAPAVRAHYFDRVLVDAPCSGLGALRRRPDARWRIEPGDVDRLAALQAQLWKAAVELVRPGGVLVWSVCTLTAAESLDHDGHLATKFEALPAPGSPWRPYGRGARLLPQDADTDGMTIIAWRIP
jgi:16S rRNA (cytosine967-C5)-methyltransferase